MNYRIRLKGHLNSYWQAWLEGVQITHEQAGTTLLTSELQDQAALYGLLGKLCQLNLPLLSHATQAQSESQQPETV